MTDTAKSAREIIHDWLYCSGSGNSAADLIATLNAKGFQIVHFERRKAPPFAFADDEAATPAVGEVSEEGLAELIARTLWGEYGGAYCLGSLHWEEATDDQRAECLGDAKSVLAAIRPRLKAEGLREAAALSDSAVTTLRSALDQGRRTSSFVALDLARLFRERADAVEKGEG